jgi:hypothetical protein
MPDLLDANGNPVKPTEEAAKPQANEELATLRSQVASLQDTIGQMRSAMEVVAWKTMGGQLAPAPVAEPEITDDEINAALRDADEGNPAAKVRTLVDRVTKRTEEQLRREVSELRAAGLSSIAEVASVQASNTLPHFKEYEKEIRAAVSKLDPALQARADTWRFAHDAIVGAHADEIVNRALEAERRQNRESAAKASTPGNGPGVPLTDSKGNKVASVEELGGEEARQALRVKGVSEDEFARRMGYKSWSDYLEKTSNIEEAGR